MWNKWSWGFIEGLFVESGIFNDAPLGDFLYNIGVQLLPFKRKYVITATNVNTGSVQKFDENTFTNDKKKMAKEALSSSSIPFVFPPQNWSNDGLPDTVLMDGGVAYNVNMNDAIRRCREVVDSDSKITIDIISCDNEYKIEGEVKGVVHNYLLNRDINKGVHRTRDIFHFMQGYPKVNFRHIVIASEHMTSGIGLLDFKNETTWKFQELGRKDGNNAMKLGGSWLKQMMNLWNQDEQL